MSGNLRHNTRALRAVAGRAPRPGRPPCGPLSTEVFGYFDCCYLLNLDSDADRLKRSKARLRRLGVDFERFAALGAPTPCPSFPNRPSLTPGLFACARSHLAIMHRAMERGE